MVVDDAHTAVCVYTHSSSCPYMQPKNSSFVNTALVWSCVWPPLAMPVPLLEVLHSRVRMAGMRGGMVGGGEAISCPLIGVLFGTGRACEVRDQALGETAWRPQ